MRAAQASPGLPPHPQPDVGGYHIMWNLNDDGDDLVSTAPARFILIQVILRWTWLAPQVDGFHHNVPGNQDDNDDGEEYDA